MHAAADAVIRHDTRRPFTAMIDLALAEDVAFVVIAGDLNDGDWKDFYTGLFFAGGCGGLGVEPTTTFFSTSTTRGPPGPSHFSPGLGGPAR
jgi:hypothetical protein